MELFIEILLLSVAVFSSLHASISIGEFVKSTMIELLIEIQNVKIKNKKQDTFLQLPGTPTDGVVLHQNLGFSSMRVVHSSRPAVQKPMPTERIENRKIFISGFMKVENKAAVHSLAFAMYLPSFCHCLILLTLRMSEMSVVGARGMVYKVRLTGESIT